MIPSLLMGAALAKAPPAQVAPPAQPDPFVQIDGGYLHTCALRQSGEALCWGGDELGQTRVPQGARFVEVRAGLYHSCGRLADGSVSCWGREVPATGNATGPLAGPPEGLPALVTLDASQELSCGLDRVGQVQCWGNEDPLLNDVPVEPDFVQLSVGYSHACARRVDGSLLCWGEGANPDGGAPFQAVPPPWPVTQVATGLGYHTCALRQDGSIGCWGGDGAGDGGSVFAGHLRAPPGQYVALTSGYDHSCALRADGTATCWGEVEDPPQDLRFEQVSSGAFHACGIVKGGAAIHCWGHDQFGQVGRLPEAMRATVP